MAKQSQIHRVIAQLEAEIAFRQHAIDALRAQLLTTKPAKVRKLKDAKAQPGTASA